ncbi:MAG: hypothetical protein CMM94_07915 [Rickettsiales bacterium]|nr:hypothetical protein [Rickettsiales bacterium]
MSKTPRNLILLSMALISSACGQIQRAFDPHERWAVVYASEIDEDSAAWMDVLVMDAYRHPPLEHYKTSRNKVLGYVSLGEVQSFYPYYDRLEQSNVILGKNEQWDSLYVDIRSDLWREIFLKEAIPAVIDQGFDGIMIDTVDSAIALEQQNPEQYAQMQEYAAHTIAYARHLYPDITIMVNRGFEILPQIADKIDYVLAESILVEHDLKTSNSKLFSDDIYGHYVTLLKQLQKQHPHIKVYTLDYWSPKDNKGIKAIYNMQRANGFIPFVSTPDLRHIHKEAITSSAAPVKKGTDHA